MHEVLCRKNKAGDVRVYFRKSSRASNWLPEGDGMPVFKSIPQGQPKVANAKEDQEWRRLAVEGTVREWFRYMSVTQQQAQQIREDWERRFASLPPNGNYSHLPAREQLKWRDLPRRQPRHVEVDIPVYATASSTLENPPVNPIIPNHRSRPLD